MERVVITGMGILSPAGSNLTDFWNSLINGKSCVGNLTKLDSSIYEGKTLAAEVEDISVEECQDYFSGHDWAVVRYGAYATKMSLIDAGLFPLKEPNNFGVIIGSSNVNQEIVENIIDEYSIKDINDNLTQPACIELQKGRPIALCSSIANIYNFGGVNFVVPTLCASGNYAISTAYSLIKSGKSPLILAGGVDYISRINYTIFYNLGAMTRTKCCPFDKDRSGIVVGEGAAILVLESLDHALSRNAKIYGEITGSGLSCDAYHYTHPDPSGAGLAKAMNYALKESGLSLNEISYVNAHGTGTITNDVQEITALKKVFGEQLCTIPINSIKSMIGHCMGAASAIAAVASILSIRDSIIPPTINTEFIDPSFENDADIVIKNAREKQITNVLSNAMGFGGNNCSIIFSKYKN